MIIDRSARSVTVSRSLLWISFPTLRAFFLSCIALYLPRRSPCKKLSLHHTRPRQQHKNTGTIDRSVSLTVPRKKMMPAAVRLARVCSIAVFCLDPQPAEASAAVASWMNLPFRPVVRTVGGGVAGTGAAGLPHALDGTSPEDHRANGFLARTKRKEDGAEELRHAAASTAAQQAKSAVYNVSGAFTARVAAAAATTNMTGIRHALTSSSKAVRLEAVPECEGAAGAKSTAATTGSCAARGNTASSKKNHQEGSTSGIISNGDRLRFNDKIMKYCMQEASVLLRKYATVHRDEKFIAATLSKGVCEILKKTFQMPLRSDLKNGKKAEFWADRMKEELKAAICDKSSEIGRFLQKELGLKTRDFPSERPDIDWVGQTSRSTTSIKGTNQRQPRQGQQTTSDVPARNHYEKENQRPTTVKMKEVVGKEKQGSSEGSKLGGRTPNQTCCDPDPATQLVKEGSKQTLSTSSTPPATPATTARTTSTPAAFLSPISDPSALGPPTSTGAVCSYDGRATPEERAAQKQCVEAAARGSPWLVSTTTGGPIACESSTTGGDDGAGEQNKDKPDEISKICTDMGRLMSDLKERVACAGATISAGEGADVEGEDSGSAARAQPEEDAPILPKQLDVGLAWSYYVVPNTGDHDQLHGMKASEKLRHQEQPEEEDFCIEGSERGYARSSFGGSSVMSASLPSVTASWAFADNDEEGASEAETQDDLMGFEHVEFEVGEGGSGVAAGE